MRKVTSCDQKINTNIKKKWFCQSSCKTLWSAEEYQTTNTQHISNIHTTMRLEIGYKRNNNMAGTIFLNKSRKIHAIWPQKKPRYFQLTSNTSSFLSINNHINKSTRSSSWTDRSKHQEAGMKCQPTEETKTGRPIKSKWERPARLRKPYFRRQIRQQPRT